MSSAQVVPESGEDSTLAQVEASFVGATQVAHSPLGSTALGSTALGTAGSNSPTSRDSASAAPSSSLSAEPISSTQDSSFQASSFATRLWVQCLARLKAEVNTHLFSAYVKPLRLAALDLEQREFVISAPSLFIRNHVEGNFSDILLCVLRQEALVLIQSGAIMHSAAGASSSGDGAAWNDSLLEAQAFGVKFLVDPLLQQNAVRQAPIFVKKSRPSVASNFANAPQGRSVSGSGMNAVQNSQPQQVSRTSSSPSVNSQFGSGARATPSASGIGQGSLGHSAPGKSSLSATSVHERRIQSGLNPKYTFSNFVVGNNNQFCNAAASRVAEEPGKSYNPLFIYGGVGLGKTHLMHAIGNALLDRDPTAHVVYQSSETFTNELIQALRNAKMDEFKRRMRSVDLLLIDDIQFMSGKERTQEEFFHTFNTLYNAKHQIVITSDKVPQDISGLEERLQTRFAWGLTADLQAPDFETRVAILRRKAALDGFTLPEDVAQLIAEKIFSNVRELEGALTRVHAITSLQNIPLTLEVANAALKPLLQPKQTIISVDDIKRAVAQHFNLKVSEIISKRRTKNLSFPRHIAMYLCRKHTTCSYPEIGSHFGNRDHSSVIHAAGVVSTKVGNDTSVRELVAEIERRLLSR